MSYASRKNITEVRPTELVREYYREKTALFGLIRWDVVQGTETIGTMLLIECEKKPKKVILNGIEYKPVK